MKYFGVIIFILGLTFYSCSHNNNPKAYQSDKHSDGLASNEVSKNIESIQNLIQQVLIWGDSKESIDLLPVLSDSKDSAFIGFDMDKLKANLLKLKKTGFFDTEFIENYNKIICTLDRKIRNKEIEWLVGDLPPFNFVSDINPWCQCQDLSQDDFDNVEIVKMDSNSGVLTWKWKKGSSWNNFKFKAVKVDNRWKISYMEGFDLKESIK